MYQGVILLFVFSKPGQAGNGLMIDDCRLMEVAALHQFIENDNYP